jgi:hypothetical protein
MWRLLGCDAFYFRGNHIHNHLPCLWRQQECLKRRHSLPHWPASVGNVAPYNDCRQSHAHTQVYTHNCVNQYKLGYNFDALRKTNHCSDSRMCVKLVLIYYTLFWIMVPYSAKRGTRWRIWLRHCTTSRKVAGSIPQGVTGIFHWLNPSCRTMTLGSTQPLTEITRDISSGVKAYGVFRAEHLTSTFRCGLCRNSVKFNQACNRIALQRQAGSIKCEVRSAKVRLLSVYKVA